MKQKTAYIIYNAYEEVSAVGVFETEDLANKFVKKACWAEGLHEEYDLEKDDFEGMYEVMEWVLDHVTFYTA